MTTAREPTNLSLHIDSVDLTYKRGDIVLYPETNDDFVYEVIAGMVKVYALDTTGNEAFHLVYGPGEIFPLSWLIGKRRLDAYIEATIPTTLRQFKREDFLAALETDHAAALHVIRKLTLQLSIYASRIDNLAFKYASQRVAYRVIFLAQRFGVQTAQGLELPPFTNQDIGDTVNLSRESVNRELSRLSRAGYITTNGNVITVVDMEALRYVVDVSGATLYIDDFSVQ